MPGNLIRILGIRMSQSKEEQLDSAVFRGELEKVKSLCSDPALNVNWQDERGFTPLSGACQEGHVGGR